MEWSCWEEVERLQDRYLRWVLGVKRYMPGYMVREEIQREKLKGRAGIRAWKYEIRLEEGKGEEMARDCWDEIKNRAKKGRAWEGWEEERKKYWEKRG